MEKEVDCMVQKYTNSTGTYGQKKELGFAQFRDTAVFDSFYEALLSALIFPASETCSVNRLMQ
jgi:hypothetical protein